MIWLIKPVGFDSSSALVQTLPESVCYFVPVSPAESDPNSFFMDD